MKRTAFFLILISFALTLSNCDKTPMTIGYKGVYYDLATGLNEDRTQLYDRRDNNIYKVVTIGKQTWMAENVRYEFSSGDPANNENQICPLGWHMPLKEEWQEMINYLNKTQNPADALKSDTAWNGSNSSGFNAIPINNTAKFWTASNYTTANYPPPSCGYCHTIYTLFYYYYTINNSSVTVSSSSYTTDPSIKCRCVQNF